MKKSTKFKTFPSDKSTHTINSSLWKIVFFAIAAFFLANCSSTLSTSQTTTSNHPSNQSSPNGSSATITIKNYAYSPSSLSVSPGETIIVQNNDQMAHTVTAKDQAFDTGGIPAGSSTSFKAPEKAGSYEYSCTFHTFMHGVLIVK